MAMINNQMVNDIWDINPEDWNLGIGIVYLLQQDSGYTKVQASFISFILVWCWFDRCKSSTIFIAQSSECPIANFRYPAKIKFFAG